MNKGLPKSFVYILSAGTEMLKIGIAKNVNKRLAGLQTGCPYPLYVVHTVPIADTHAYNLEKTLHRQLKRYRVRGEWFKMRQTLAADLVDRFASQFAKDRTIAAAGDDSMTLAYLECRDCHHSGSVRVPAEPRLRFKCSACGSRRTVWRL